MAEAEGFHVAPKTFGLDGALPKFTLLIATEILMVLVTLEAALKLEFPDWLAVTAQFPELVRYTRPPEI